MAGYKLSAALLNRKKAPGKVADGLALSFCRNKDGSLTAWQRVKIGGKTVDKRVASTSDEITQDWLQKVRADAYTIKMAGSGSSGAMTFQTAWEAFFKAIAESRHSKWSKSTSSQAKARMLKWIAPTALWMMPVVEIRSSNIEQAMIDIRKEYPKMAPKLLALIGQVISYAAHDLDLEVNAAKVLKDRLKSTEKKVRIDKLPAITDLPGIGRLLHAIENSSLFLTTRVALLLQAYSAQRSGAVAGAMWCEFRFNQDGTVTWTIPRARMKVSDTDQKPCDLVLTMPPVVAELIKRLPTNSDWLFVPRHGDSDCITVEAFSQAFQRLGFRGVAVPHGWRSSLKTLGEDAADDDGRPLFSHRWIEDVLDHSVKGVEGSYTRAQAEKGVARVLAWWADQLVAALKQHVDLLQGK